jgi:hypothetical protein
MSEMPSVILLHDGELDDVRELLDQLGANYLQLRGGEISERIDPPEHLLIATSRRAMLARDWPPSRGTPPRPFKIGIVSEDSNTLRSMLRRIGFDLLIRRPVHPYALRLLILHALYSGDERRKEERVPVGYEISYRSGIRRKRIVLAELDLRGGRLISDQPIGVGTRLTLDLPSELTGGRSLQLRAKVIRSVAGGQGTRHDQHTVAIRFEKMSAGRRNKLLGVVRDHARGPAVLPEAMARASGALTNSQVRAAGGNDHRLPAAGPGSLEDRRKHRRAAFERTVESLDEEAKQVLMGRDLSMGGMRIDPHPNLTLGTKLRLAIYGAPGDEPFVVRARVVRADGASGVGLRFEQVATSVAMRLESLVASLPSVESLHGSETDAIGSVVSRILETEGEI